MPRRPRQSKARQSADRLTVLSAHAQVAVRGCTDIPVGITLDDLYWAWTICNEREGSWGWWAFRETVPRPCEAMTGEPDPFDGDISRPPTCAEAGERCVFKELKSERDA